MTEEEARQITQALAGASAMRRLERLVEMVVEESGKQNLIAASTLPAIWTRHVLDSIQLLRFAPSAGGPWIDIGTGGGFPGLAIAAADPDREMVLIEPRRRRAEFLHAVAVDLRLPNIMVEHSRVEAVARRADIISARAVSSIEKLLHAARQCATPATRWILPRGRTTEEELATLADRWQGTFHVEQSLTDQGSRILVAEGVKPR